MAENDQALLGVSRVDRWARRALLWTVLVTGAKSDKNVVLVLRLQLVDVKRT